MSEYYAGQQKYVDAMKALQAGLQKQPTNFALRLALAGMEELQGDHEAAITGYDALLKEQPGSLVIMNNLASLLSDHQKRPSQLGPGPFARCQFDVKTEVPQFKDTLGWAQYRQGDFKSAIELLEEAQQALPNLALVRYHLGMSYLADGRIGESNRAAEKGPRTSPNERRCCRG